MRRLVIIAAALLLLALAGGQDAQAKATPPAEGWGAAELRIAAEYWGVATPPLCGSTAVEFDAALPANVYGIATVPAQPGTVCRMQIAARAVIGTLYAQCLTVVHEFGHWLGLGHSADVSSPMAAELNPTIRVRGCERLASVTNVTHKPRRPR